MPAQTTAKRVMASAKRLSELRQCCPRSSKSALIRVPAWPMPSHQIYMAMSRAQLTGMFSPQTPTPFQNSTVAESR